MKKIVFLFLLLFITPSSLEAKTLNTNCFNGEIEINDSYEEGISVLKRGPNPFLSILDEQDGYFHVRDMLCTDDIIVIYGYAHFDNNPTYYEGFMIALDASGNEIYRKVFDYGELEEVVNIVYFDYVFGLIIHQHEYTEDPEFMQSYILLLDSDFNQLKESYYNQEIISVFTKDNVMAVNFGYDTSFDIGIVSDLTEIYPDQIFTFEEHYYHPINIPFINEALINGEIVSNGVTLSYPGHYEFVYNKQKYEFTVHPTVTGVEDNNLYYEPVSIHVNEGNVFLNNELYINGTLVTAPGNYQLKVEGTGNYSYELTFAIGSTIQGVVNGVSYDEPITVSFTGQGYLNSNQVTSPIIVDQEGEYVLRVLGENGYSEEYHFSLNYETNFNLIEFIQKIDIFIMVGVVITGVVIIKKSK